MLNEIIPLRSYNAEAYTRKPTGYENFIVKHSYPLHAEVVDASLQYVQPGAVIDVVGFSSPQNFKLITEGVQKNGPCTLRLFDPKKENCENLQFYVDRDWGKPDGIDVEIFNDTYENASANLPKRPTLVYVDKTFLHATKPISLMKTLISDDPEKVIVLCCYGEHSFQMHKRRKGKPIGRSSNNDLHGGDFLYAGACPNASILLKDGIKPLYVKEKTYGEIIAYPHRIGSHTIVRSQNVQLPEQIDDEAVRTDGIWITYGKKYWAKLDRKLMNQILQGEFEIWLSPLGKKYLESSTQERSQFLYDLVSQLSFNRKTPNDKKLNLIPFSYDEMIIQAKNLTTSKLKRVLSPKYYE